MIRRREFLVGTAAFFAASSAKAVTPATRAALLGGALPAPTSAESAAFRARALAASPGLSRTYLVAVDALITGLVNDGVWPLIDAIYRRDAPTQAAALLNLKSSSYTSTITGTPTFVPNYGFTGNGTNGCIDTNLNPSTAGGNYSQNSAHVAAWNNKVRGISSKALVSLRAAVALEADIYPRYSDGKTYLRANDNPVSAGVTCAGVQGFFLANRSNSTARQGYYNGTSVGTYGSVSSSALPNANFRELVSNDGTQFSSDQVRCSSYGGSLTPTQALALYNRMAACTNAIMSINPSNYLYACFNLSSQELLLLQSGDGLDWKYRHASCVTPNALKVVRDPSIAYFPTKGKFYTAFTNTVFGTANSSFDIVESSNGHDFTATRSVDCSAVLTGGSTYVWAPEWFYNPDGSPWLDSNGKPAIMVSCSSQMDGGGFRMYVTQPTDANDYSAPWTTPAVVTGTGLPVGVIDAFPIVNGTDITVWFQNSVSGYIVYMTGTTASLTSGYTVQKTGDWAGWGNKLEGQCVLYPNYPDLTKIRIYLDSNPSGTPGIYYSDSTDSGATWSAKALITAPFTPEHGTIIPLTAFKV